MSRSDKILIFLMIIFGFITIASSLVCALVNINIVKLVSGIFIGIGGAGLLIVTLIFSLKHGI